MLFAYWYFNIFIYISRIDQIWLLTSKGILFMFWHFCKAAEHACCSKKSRFGLVNILLDIFYFMLLFSVLLTRFPVLIISLLCWYSTCCHFSHFTFGRNIMQVKPLLFPFAIETAPALKNRVSLSTAFSSMLTTYSSVLFFGKFVMRHKGRMNLLWGSRPYSVLMCQPGLCRAW